MKIALIGNQNSGKTTVFNLLTGMNAKVGNWPGVTIEKKEGIIKGTSHNIVDLPGIYSLCSYSIEEEITKNFIMNESPEVIINIIDSTCLERSLYLTTQLLELNCKIIVALNMTDILEKKGNKIDSELMEKILGVKVIKISALKSIGISDLIDEINKFQHFENKYHYTKNNYIIYNENIENLIYKNEKLLGDNIVHKRFLSVKNLELDESNNYDEIIACERYKFVEQVRERIVSGKIVNNKISITDKIDKIVLNKWLAFPIFIIIMFCIYYVSVGVVGKYTSGFIANKISLISENVNEVLINIHTYKWLNSLVIDGIFSGVGAVLSFTPQLLILYICIAILETTGYMSRIAMILDKVFRNIGLSGKSLIPFIIGSGCSVPGITGTRIIESEHEKQITTILTPFVPCNAKLPIITLFSSYFFSKNSGIVSASLYFLAIIIIILSAVILNKCKMQNKNEVFISELPEYKIPSIKYILKDVYEKVTSFLKRAGSVILICSIVIWFLLSFSIKFEYGVNIQNSILASIGKIISPLFYPMLGANSWEATVSAIQGLVAKEQVVSSMNVISVFFGDEIKESGQIFATGGAFGFFTPLSAYAFVVFNLFSAPCVAAIATMKKELGGTKKVIKAVLFQTSLAWILATGIYQIGNGIKNFGLNLGSVLVILIIVLLVYLVFSNLKEVKRCSKCGKCV